MNGKKCIWDLMKADKEITISSAIRAAQWEIVFSKKDNPNGFIEEIAKDAGDYVFVIMYAQENGPTQIFQIGEFNDVQEERDKYKSAYDVLEALKNFIHV